MKPYVGKVVHYVVKPESMPVALPTEAAAVQNIGDALQVRPLSEVEIKQLPHHPATIVYVSQDNRCNLTVLDIWGNHYWQEEVPFDPEAKTFRSWHFIEEEAQAAAG